MTKTDTSGRKALIYCRVASTTRALSDEGFSSQEQRCRDYAGQNGYTVDAVFEDHASGNEKERPGVLAMLAHIREHQGTEYVVVIDDVARLARSLVVHLQLRNEIAGAGASLESPSFRFREDPTSKCFEQFVVVVNQYQCEKQRVTKNA